MRKILLMLVVLALTGCANMTTGQKTAAWIVGGAIVVGAVASSGSSSNDHEHTCFFAISGDRSTRICN